jgi:NAD+ kinase
VHAGNIGFLTEIDKNELHLLDKLASGNYRIEKRMRIKASMYESGGTKESFHSACALNEITVTSASPGRGCASITVLENGRAFAEYRGDGLIFATPTGSTGYSLSAGGAVLDPALEAILLTPLCSHTLIAKPLVFSPTAELSIVSRETLSVRADSGDAVVLPAGGSLSINKAESPASFIRLKDTPFAARLEKLK